MSSNLLADLGLEFIDPYSVNAGLKQLKPQDEPQIFSVITQLPGCPNTVLKFPQHNFSVLRKTIRCTGGSCCIKSKELADSIAKLPEEERKKANSGKRQTRILLPVVLYQGKSASAYGGPVEVRYLNISEFTYLEWDSARDAVNADIAPFYERDFILTKKSAQMPAAQMHHLESRAKWLTDPAINAEVMKQISDPKFLENFLKVVPPKLSEEDFLREWDTARRAQIQQTTEAEKAILNQNVGLIQQPIQVTQPVQPQTQVPINPLAEPMVQVQSQVAPSTPVAQPVQITPSPQTQQIQPTVQVPLNVGLPITAVNPNSIQDVAFTPQNLINGSYNAGGLTGVITPEAITNMQPVSIGDTQPVNVTHVNETPASGQDLKVETSISTPATPAPQTAEISLANIGDLDAIINSLPAKP